MIEDLLPAADTKSVVEVVLKPWRIINSAGRWRE